MFIFATQLFISSSFKVQAWIFGVSSVLAMEVTNDLSIRQFGIIIFVTKNIMKIKKCSDVQMFM